jgi:cell division transport system permease protein
MSAWLHAHLAALRDAWRQARRTPVATLLSIGVLALALALPLVGFVVGSGLARIAEGFDTDPQIAVFLPPEASARDRQALERAVRARPGVKRLRVVTKEQALAELQATEGVRDLLAGLPGNPLPDTLVIVPSDPGRAAVDALQADLARLPGVGSVQVDRAWVERLEQVLRTARALTLAVAALLGVAVVAVTFNTIRLQVLTRAAELEVATLFGATGAWLRRPFLYFGALQGVGAGVLAVALAAGFVATLVRGFPVEAAALALPDGVAPMPWKLALTAILIGAGLGSLGAWLSVWEHLGPRRTPAR